MSLVCNQSPCPACGPMYRDRACFHFHGVPFEDARDAVMFMLATHPDNPEDIDRADVIASDAAGRVAAHLDGRERGSG